MSAAEATPRRLTSPCPPPACAHFEVLAARSRAPVDPTRTLRAAMGLRNALPHEGGLEPLILLLTHPWLGAEDEDDADLPTPPHLRALFVAYPRYAGVTPTLSARCERSVVLAAGDGERLGEELAEMFSG